MATLPIAWCLGWLSHGYPVSQVSHLMESSCAYVAHRKVPSCAYVPHVEVPSCAFVAHRVCPLLCPKLSIALGAPYVPLCAYGSHRKVQSCANFHIARCHRVLKMPIACCILVPSCIRQGAIVCQYCPSQDAVVCLCFPFTCATMC